MSSTSNDRPSGDRALSGLARHSLIYSIAPLAQKALALLLVHVYTSVLARERMGVVEITDVLFVAAIQLAGINLMSGLVRFYFEQENERDRAALISSGTLFTMLVSWALVGVAIVFRGPLSEFLFVTNDPALVHDDLPACLLVVLLSIPLAMSSEAGFRYLQVLQRSRAITTLRVVKALFEMTLRVYTIVYLGWGVMGFLISTLIGELITTVCLTGWVLSRTGLSFSWRVLEPVVRYTLPLVPVGLCQMGLHQIDRVLLKQFGPEDGVMAWAGLYGHGYKVGNLVQYVVVGSIMQIWQPWIFGVRDPLAQGQQLSRVSTYLFLTVAVISIGVMGYGRELIYLLSGQESYKIAYRVVPWIAAGYVFFALNGLSQIGLFIAKRTWPMLWINLSALVVNVAANYWLIPQHAYVGSAIATLITFGWLAVVGLVVASRHVTEPFELRRLTAIAGLVLAAMVAFLWVDEVWGGHSLATLTWILAPKTLLVGAAVALLWFAVLRRDERDEITRWARGRWPGKA